MAGWGGSGFVEETVRFRPAERAAQATRLAALEKLAEKAYVYRSEFKQPSRGMGAGVFWARDELFKALAELERL